jgi:hypothetical protein
VVEPAVGDAAAHALELLVDDEVDKTGDSVGAVHRGGAAGENVDALDQRGWDVVEVRCIGASGVARRQALTVQQHQGADRAQVTQVHRGGSRATVDLDGGLAGIGLRQLVDQVLDTAQAREGDLLHAHDRDRAQALHVGARDESTGDGDLFLE